MKPTKSRDGEAVDPVLYLTQEALFTWEQHAPGGCGCVCKLYHGDPDACLEPAEPGRLLRVVAPSRSWAPADVSEPLPLCGACYAAIAPLANTRPTGACDR